MEINCSELTVAQWLTYSCICFKDPSHLILTGHFIMWQIWQQLLKTSNVQSTAQLLSFPEVLHYCRGFLKIRGQAPQMAHRCPPHHPASFAQAWFNEPRVPGWDEDISNLISAVWKIPFKWTACLHVQLSKQNNVNVGFEGGTENERTTREDRKDVWF